MNSQSQQYMAAGSLREPGPRAELELWPDRLQRIIDEQCTLLKRIIVLRETDSTQDAAKRMKCVAGDVLTAWRQTGGRGRLGRTWADTQSHGIAVTFVVDRRDQKPESLAIAAAVGAANAVESLLKRPAGIKWPNDIVVDQRKLAGILIEQVDDCALVGIGMNVSQADCDWPVELAAKAVSLRQLGLRVDRLNVLEALIPAIDRCLKLQDDELAKEFTKRDVLIGTQGTFRAGEKIISGRVLRIDPLRGLAVQTHTGEQWLAAATTSVLPG